jgi:tetratricopeptide (TPR) repeat protein
MLADQQRSRYGGRSLDYGLRALAIARTHHLRETRGYILLDLGRAYGAIGYLEEAEETLNEAIRLWRELDNRPLLADSLATLAQGMLMDGRAQEGIPLAEEALQIAQSIDNRWGQSFASYNVALLYEEVGRFSEAFAAYYAAAHLGRGGGFAGPGYFTPLMLTIAYCYLGAPDYQRDRLTRLLDEMEDRPILGMVRPLMDAMRTLYHGQPDKAYAITEPLYEQVREFIDPGMGGPLVAALFAQVALAAGQAAAALEAIEGLIEQAEATGNGLYLQDMLYFKGQAFYLLGQAEEGKAALLAAAAEARRQTSRRSLWFILATLHEIAVEEGDTAKATRLAGEGREVVSYVAEHLSADPELREAFLSLPAMRPFVLLFNRRD